IFFISKFFRLILAARYKKRKYDKEKNFGKGQIFGDSKKSNNLGVLIQNLEKSADLDRHRLIKIY
ncbi:MAG: hypothetical protein K8S16_01085, partial [Bacteroidales bacterium]|nr:hypothetical protein [Bacteroidales bacterium]